MDYPADVLHRPISFHKFWQIDPYEVYTKWLTNFDEHDRPQQPHVVLATAASATAAQPNQSHRNQINAQRANQNDNNVEIDGQPRNVIKISATIKNDDEL